MKSTSIILPFLALAAKVLAAPVPLYSVARSAPNLHEVIRNPAPIDNGCAIDLSLLDIKLCLGGRALEAEDGSVVSVINR
jgi:hypothetical protein